MVSKYYMPTEIIFGAGALKDVVRYLNTKDRVCLITDKGLVQVGIAETVFEVVKNVVDAIEIFDEVEVNPRPDTVKKGLDKVKEMEANIIIGLGGGSPLDVAKIVSTLATNEGNLVEYQWEGRKFENSGLTFIAVPTTAGTGSEVTRVSVIVDRNVKKGIVSDKLFPTVAIVDPQMMTSLPPQLTATTGMDALTHAVEAYIGLGANSFTDAYALEAINLLAEYLPRAFANGDDIFAREQVAKASTLAGIAMDQAGLGIVHALASPLSSYYDIPHGLANAVLLPHGMKYNLIANPVKLANIAQCFGIDVANISVKEAANKAVEAVEQLCSEMDIAETLADYFQVEEDVEKFGEEAASTFLARNNPRKVSAKDCEKIFRKVFGLN